MKEELISGAPKRIRLIDDLTRARLLSVHSEHGEPTLVEVDLIHDALLSNWDRLQQEITEPTTTIDVSTLPNGIYLVKLVGEKEVKTGKFIKN